MNRSHDRENSILESYQVEVEFEPSNESGMFFSMGRPVSIETDRVLEISPWYYISSRLEEYFETLRGAACEIELLFFSFHLPLLLLLPMSPVKLPLSPARPSGSCRVSSFHVLSRALWRTRDQMKARECMTANRRPGNGLLWSSSKDLPHSHRMAIRGVTRKRSSKNRVVPSPFSTTSSREWNDQRVDMCFPSQIVLWLKWKWGLTREWVYRRAKREWGRERERDRKSGGQGKKTCKQLSRIGTLFRRFRDVARLWFLSLLLSLFLSRTLPHLFHQDWSHVVACSRGTKDSWHYRELRKWHRPHAHFVAQNAIVDR